MFSALVFAFFSSRNQADPYVLRSGALAVLLALGIERARAAGATFRARPRDGVLFNALLAAGATDSARGSSRVSTRRPRGRSLLALLGGFVLNVAAAHGPRGRGAARGRVRGSPSRRSSSPLFPVRRAGSRRGHRRAGAPPRQRRRARAARALPQCCRSTRRAYAGRGAGLGRLDFGLAPGTEGFSRRTTRSPRSGTDPGSRRDGPSGPPRRFAKPPFSGHSRHDPGPREQRETRGALEPGYRIPIQLIGLG